jgi:hypothetical protein
MLKSRSVNFCMEICHKHIYFVMKFFCSSISDAFKMRNCGTFDKFNIMAIINMQ